MRRRVAVAMLFLVAMTARPQLPMAAGGLLTATVFSVKGPAEAQADPGSAWKPLKKDTFLRTGARVRTGAGGSVTLAFDARMEGLAHLRENSRLEILRSPDHVRLESGKLFLVLEQDTERQPEAVDPKIDEAALTVMTQDVRLDMGNGGCGVEASPEGTQIKTYGGSVAVTAKGGRRATVEEGFLYSSSTVSGASRFERMKAADYNDWQDWTRFWYEKKDDFESERNEKDIARRKAAQKEET